MIQKILLKYSSLDFRSTLPVPLSISFIVQVASSFAGTLGALGGGELELIVMASAAAAMADVSSLSLEDKPQRPQGSIFTSLEQVQYIIWFEL